MVRARSALLALLTVLAVAGSGALVAPPAAAAVPSPPRSTPAQLGTFHPGAPARVLDTRTTGAALKAGEVRVVALAGKAGVPAAASAVVANLTVTGAAAGGHLTAYADGSPRPTASTLNFTRGSTIANLATVPLSGGRMAVHNGSGGTVHLVVDVSGWYDARLPLTSAPAPGSRFVPVAPELAARVHDAAVRGGVPAVVQVSGRGGVPDGATGVLLNVTGARPTTRSHVTVWPAGTAQPAVSNLNLAAGVDRANLAAVRLPADGRVAAALNGGTGRLVLDVVGYYVPVGADDAGRLSPVAPSRILETRPGKVQVGGLTRALGPGESFALRVTGAGGVPSQQVDAVVLNVTAVGGTARSHLRVHPTSTTLAATSSLNFAAGSVTSTGVVARVGSGGRVTLYNHAGSVHLVVDVVGWYATAPSVAAPAMPAVVAAPPGYDPSAATFAAPAPARRTGAPRLDPATVARLLADAEPTALPARDATGATAREATGAQTFTGIPQPDYPRWAAGYLPDTLYRNQVGQLLFFDVVGGEAYFTALCSGSVVGRQSVLTAAHCLYDENGYSWDGAVFLPGLRGTAWTRDRDPYWEAQYFLTDGVYASTPNTKDAGHPYYAADYAVLSMYADSVTGRRLGDVVAPLPVKAAAPAGTKVTLGYPAGGGTFRNHCEGGDCYQWFCQSPTGSYLQHAAGWAEVGIGCRLGGGNSGGPVVQHLDGRWQVVSVVSNGPSANDGASRNVWGPHLNSWATDLVADSEALPAG